MIDIIVYGTPAPQGSKSFKGMFKSKKTGRQVPKLVESSKALKPWREAVKWAALAAKNGAPPIPGAVRVEMIFTIAKPKSASRRRKTFPDKRPDLSKCVRATEDALVDAGIIEDDARIIDCLSSKVFPGEGASSLATPGAVIRIRSAG